MKTKEEKKVEESQVVSAWKPIPSMVESHSGHTYFVSILFEKPLNGRAVVYFDHCERYTESTLYQRLVRAFCHR